MKRLAILIALIASAAVVMCTGWFRMGTENTPAREGPSIHGEEENESPKELGVRLAILQKSSGSGLQYCNSILFKYVG